MTGTANTPSYGQPEATYGQPAQAAWPAGVPATRRPSRRHTPYQGQQAAQPAQAPNAGTWGQPSPQPVVQAPQKDISLALFDAGVKAFNARKYEEAQRSFTDFLKNYKDHNLAPEAQYYLAECYFQRNQFADAALAYDTVIKKYPKSTRTPGAYLKQGISFSKINQGAAAKARMPGTDQEVPQFTGSRPRQELFEDNQVSGHFRPERVLPAGPVPAAKPSHGGERLRHEMCEPLRQGFAANPLS